MNKAQSYLLALLILAAVVPTAYGFWAARAVVFNNTTQYAKRDALPSTAPWTSLPRWELSLRLRQPSQYGQLLTISGLDGPQLYAVPASGRLDLHLLGDTVVVYHTPANINDVIYKASYDPTSDKVVVTSTRSDGTGLVTSETGVLGKTGGWDWGAQKVTLNVNYYETADFVGVHVDWVRLRSGTTALATWEFDADNGNDSSGNGLHLTIAGSPLFEDSTPEN